MQEIAEYQERVPVTDLRVGDFLYLIEPARRTGPRGGRYRFTGCRFESRITEIGYAIGRGRFGHRGFGIRTRAGGFGLPAGYEHTTTAIIKRREQ